MCQNLNTHKINVQELREDILHSDLSSCPHKTASLFSHQYFTTSRNLLDKHLDIPKHAHTGFKFDILTAKLSIGSVREYDILKTQPGIAVDITVEMFSSKTGWGQ